MTSIPQVLDDDNSILSKLFRTTMSPSKHHNLHIDLPLQRRSEHLLRETLLKDVEATTTRKGRTSVDSRSSSRTRALDSSGTLWGWFWRDNDEISSASASEEDSPFLSTPSSPIRGPVGFFDQEREGRGRTAHTNKRSRAVESLERLTSRTSIAGSGSKSKFNAGLETVPSVGDLRVLIAAHDASTSTSTSTTTSTPTTTSTSISTPPTLYTSTTSLSSPISASSGSPDPGLDHDAEPVPRDILITPPPTPPTAFNSKRPLGLPDNHPPFSRIPVNASVQKHRRALSVSLFPQRTGTMSTPSTPKRSTVPIPTMVFTKSATPKRTHSLTVAGTKRSFTTNTSMDTTTPSTATRVPVTPTPTRVHKRSTSLRIEGGTGIPRKMSAALALADIPGVDGALVVGTPPRKMSSAAATPGTPQSTKRVFGGIAEGFSNDSFPPRRNMSFTSLPSASPSISGSPRRPRTATTLAEMGVDREFRTPTKKTKAFLYSTEDGVRHPHTDPHPSTCTTTSTPNTPSSRNRFNLRTASALCKAQEGYVSFAAVEGLEEPESEVDLPAEGSEGRSGGRRRSLVRGWFGL